MGLVTKVGKDFYAVKRRRRRSIVYPSLSIVVIASH